MTIASSQPAPLSDPIQPDTFPAPPTDLPYDDGEPLETPRHRSAMNLLIRSLDHHWIQRNDYFVGGNMFLYYSATQAKNQDFRGPVFLLLWRSIALATANTGQSGMRVANIQM